MALAGEVYKRLTGALEDDPGNAGLWRKVREANRAAFDGTYGKAAFLNGDDARRAAGLEQRFGAFVDLALSWKALRIDEASRANLMTQVARAMDEAGGKALRDAEGNYRPDDNAGRFPEWKDEPQKATRSRAVGTALTTITSLLAAWGKEAAGAGKAANSTLKAYGHSVRKLVAFLGHDDASQVTPENVVAFKDARLAEVNPRNGKLVSAKTVNDGDLAGLKTVFAWAVKNRKLGSNPATGITVAVAEPVRTRTKGFTEGEALAILRQSRDYKPGSRAAQNGSGQTVGALALCIHRGAPRGDGAAEEGRPTPRGQGLHAADYA